MIFASTEILTAQVFPVLRQGPEWVRFALARFSARELPDLQAARPDPCHITLDASPEPHDLEHSDGEAATRHS